MLLPVLKVLGCDSTAKLLTCSANIASSYALLNTAASSNTTHSTDGQNY